MIPTVAGFRAWLESKDPDAVVGRCRESLKCPVAEYVLSLGYSKVVVCSARCEAYLDQWSVWRFFEFAGELAALGKFVRTVDTSMSTTVTASMALNILKRIT